MSGAFSGKVLASTPWHPQQSHRHPTSWQNPPSTVAATPGIYATRTALGSQSKKKQAAHPAMAITDSYPLARPRGHAELNEPTAPRHPCQELPEKRAPHFGICQTAALVANIPLPGSRVEPCGAEPEHAYNCYRAHVRRVRGALTTASGVTLPNMASPAKSPQ